jgi:serine/threonine-protein kinase RsbW
VRRLALAADTASLDPVHEALERFWLGLARLPRPPEAPCDAWRLLFATAVAEIGANIVRHAYAARPGLLRLRLLAFADRVEARFSDCGLPLEQECRDWAAHGQDPLSLPEGGLGLALADAALDELRYVRTPAGVNRWRLVKRFET